MGEKFIGLLLVLLVIYFGLQASDASKYFANLAQYLEDKDGFSYAMAILYKYTPNVIVFLSVGLIVASLINAPEDMDGPGISLILWAGLGWWVGKAFTKAAIAKQACLAQSTFGFGCTFNAPLFSYLFYCIVSFYVVFVVAIYLLSSFASDDNG